MLDRELPLQPWVGMLDGATMEPVPVPLLLLVEQGAAAIGHPHRVPPHTGHGHGRADAHAADHNNEPELGLGLVLEQKGTGSFSGSGGQRSTVAPTAQLPRAQLHDARGAGPAQASTPTAASAPVPVRVTVECPLGIVFADCGAAGHHADQGRGAGHVYVDGRAARRACCGVVSYRHGTSAAMRC